MQTTQYSTMHLSTAVVYIHALSEYRMEQCLWNGYPHPDHKRFIEQLIFFGGEGDSKHITVIHRGGPCRIWKNIRGG